MQVRQTVSDFAVMIAILCMAGTDAALGLGTPKLEVPAEFKVSVVCSPVHVCHMSHLVCVHLYRIVITAAEEVMFSVVSAHLLAELFAKS